MRSYSKTYKKQDTYDDILHPHQEGELRVPFGLKDGRMYEPRQVKLGKACGCVCPGCGGTLIAKHALKEKVTPHFQHQPGDYCNSGRESAIHLAAKQLIADHGKLFFPELVATIEIIDEMGYLHKPSKLMRKAGMSLLHNVRLEKAVADFRPDLMANEEHGCDLLIEVAVTSFVKEDKLVKIVRNNTATVEINASTIPIHSLDQLAKILFEPSDLINWVYHPDVKDEELKLYQQLEPTLEAAKKEAAKAEAEYKAAQNERENALKAEREKKAAQAEQRRRKAAEFKTMNAAQKLEISLQYLGINEKQIPKFLNHKVNGDGSFGVPRRVWQTSVFGAFIEKSLVLRRGKFKSDAVAQWLYQRYDVKFEFNSSDKVAVWNFLKNLSDLGVLKYLGSQWFEVAQDNLRVLIDQKVGTTESIVPKPTFDPYAIAGYRRSAYPSSSAHYSPDTTEPGIRWKDEWPPYEKAIAIANHYAETHNAIADWDRLANLPSSVKTNDPKRVIWHYSRGGDDADTIVESYLIKAGFIQRD